ncbi:MFS transporter [Pelagicoccus sp. SDUM812003]|uniref:MFS transporter n=1 Tax=Pelagicoccus sp. SDUM812003 TaxID=3041267 RepID=UPI00280C410C|nr:MFS transporter [Pelagicoccus sp. SDUM812003]MDQ8205254.1 MFS transporter [Pelagicoccus sp. SDUM812003]
MNTRKLSVLEKVGFGAGDMSINVMVAALFYLISFFYTDIFGLNPTHMGILFLVARFVDAFTDPMMGLITDRFKSKKGRFRPYFAYLALPYGLSMALLFTTPDMDYNAKLIWAYATYLFATLMFTGVAIPYISYIGVLTSDPQERLSANGYRMFFAKIANVVIVASVPVLAEWWGGEDLQEGYMFAMGLMSGIGVLLLWFCYGTTRERVEHKVNPQPLGTQIKYLLKNDQWLVLAGCCLLGTFGYAIRGSVALYYAKYYLGGDAAMASMFTSSGIAASIVSMVASTWITKRFCKIKLFSWSQILVGLMSLGMFFLVGPGDVVMAFTLYVLLSFVVDLHAPVFWSAIAEAVDYGHIKDGQRVSGLSFGGISFCQKAGGGLAGLAGGLLLTFFDYQPNVQQTEFTLTGLALMLTIIPGAFHAALGFLLFKYKITDRFYQKMVAESSVIQTKSPDVA